VPDWLPAARIRRFLAAIVILVLGMAAGCSPSSQSGAGRLPSATAGDARSRQELFQNAIDNLHRLEQFQPQAMLEQVRQQLNQSVDWKRPVDWQRDAMLASLPEAFGSLPMLLSLEDLKLNAFDTLHLQEALALHDVARLAADAVSDDLERARRLFDWTVRNIQPMQSGELGTDERGEPLRAMHLPYQSLFFGRGDAIDRAWIFVLLCRQQELDAVVLAIPGHDAGVVPRPWAVGVLVGEQIYPFDLNLGIIIPGKDGQAPAPLGELAGDDSLLRQLDVDAENPYPLKADDLARLVALVDASPGYLARRMQVLESKLAGDRKIVLTTRPSEVAERLKKHPQIAQVRLWGVPFERLARQSSPAVIAALGRELLSYRLDLLPEEYRQPAADLQHGRVLHLKGILAAEEDQPSANKFYQRARLADEEIDRSALNPTQRAILHRVKEDASYWLGLVAYERGRFETAIDHFRRRTLGAGNSVNRWTSGALYNMGRAYEAIGQIDEAANAYQATQGSQRHGNLLRAKWLKSGLGKRLIGSQSPRAAANVRRS
jgi:tetratricopeptide (TPR) repeat protein